MRREREDALILTTTEGRPYTARYFGRLWQQAMKAAGLESSGLHFHDLRGTVVTMLAEARCTIPQICAITHHSRATATATQTIARYLASTRHLAPHAISRLENASETEFADRLQTRAENTPVAAKAKG